MTSHLLRLHQGFKYCVSSHYIALNPRIYREKLIADLKVRDFILRKLRKYSIANIYTKIMDARNAYKMLCTVICLLFVPSDVIVDIRKRIAANFPNLIVDLKIERYTNQDLTSGIVAAKMVSQLVERGSINRKISYVVRWALKNGASGCRIEVKGRINGIQIARKEMYQEGIIKRNCFNYDVEEAHSLLCSRTGTVGVKVWLNRNLFRANIKQKRETS